MRRPIVSTRLYRWPEERWFSYCHYNGIIVNHHSLLKITKDAIIDAEKIRSMLT